jgi:hypothetical protein
MFESVMDIRNTGFEGFFLIRDLRRSWLKKVPKEVGVYLVLRTVLAPPQFLRSSPAGRVKGKDPTVPVRKLRAHWVSGAVVLYIGKAGGPRNKSTLRSRIRELLKFGAGLQTPHCGGKYIWQVRGSRSFIICWKQTPGKVPREVEHQLIARFKDEYDGRRPFANLQD